ncbi:MAG: hypothetical protein AAF967_13900, partial [Pseudomonadota bacterium]
LEQVATYQATTDATHRGMLKKVVTDAESIADLLALQARHGIPVIAKLQLSTEADLKRIDALVDAGVLAAEVGFSKVSVVAAACATSLPISVYTLDEIACDGFSDAVGRSDPALIWGHLAKIGVRLFMTDAPEILHGHFRSA